MTQRCLAIVLLFAAACGLVTSTIAAPQDTADSPADKAFIGAMNDMMAGMHKPTGDADTDFVTMMLPPHQAAVDMAKAELEYGKDEGLKAMAQEIVTAQGKEIALMKAWEDKKRASH